MLSVSYPDGTNKSWTYDFRNQKLSETDQLGHVTKYAYDVAGQRKSMTVAFGTIDAATTTYSYDDAGRELTRTDPRGNTTINTYDIAGRMTTTTDGAGYLDGSIGINHV